MGPGCATVEGDGQGWAARPDPALGLTMGYTLGYLSLIVLIPLAVLALQTAELSASALWALATGPRALASLQRTVGASLIAALVSVVLGTLLAWAIVRHRVRGRSVIDAIVDLPFALPMAVSGLALTTVVAAAGWLGITLALAGLGLPFVVRTVQPALEARAPERALVPALAPALLTGFALAFARAIGEYGAVVLIAGNRWLETETTSLLVLSRLDEHDVPGASALALVLLVVSLTMLLAITSLGAWTRRRAQS